MIALTCLALALLIRFGGSGWQPAVALGVVCAMKYTAWPALAVLIVAPTPAVACSPDTSPASTVDRRPSTPTSTATAGAR